MQFFEDLPWNVWIGGGIALFLVAIRHISETINHLVGERSKRWIGKFTKNLFTAIVTGTFTTILLNSSSTVIIISILLVTAGQLTFRQSIGIVLGANLGTAISNQLLNINTGLVPPIALVVGLILWGLFKTQKQGHWGKLLFLLGLLFNGLTLMEIGVRPLQDSQEIKQTLQHLDDPLQGAGLGALCTLMLQSSTAMMGITVKLVKQHLLSVTAGIAIMLGAELGTVGNTLLATINGTRQALRTGLFHFTFNLITILFGLIMFYPFTQLVTWIGNHASPQQQIVNAHILFNVLGILMFLPLVPLVEKFLNRAVPDK